MMNLIPEAEAREINRRIALPAHRIDMYPELDEFNEWIGRVLRFAERDGNITTLGVEAYKDDLKYFRCSLETFGSILYLTKFVPLETMAIGKMWMIGISSYPQAEGAKALEYSFRLYGQASFLKN